MNSFSLVKSAGHLPMDSDEYPAYDLRTSTNNYLLGFISPFLLSL
jgi:hypothetical protein